MRTREPFIKIAQRIYYRPKIGRLTPVERDAYFCSLCVAGETNQDGAFSIFTVTRLTGTDMDDLQGLIPGLWEPTSDGDIFTVHDWLDWNLSAEEREYRSFIYSMNGAKGGRPAKTQDIETNPEPNRYHDESNLEANGKQIESYPKANGNQNESKTKAELRSKKKELRIKKKNQETNNNNNNLLRARARKTQNRRNHATGRLETHRKPRSEMRPARNQPHRGGRGIQGLGGGRENLSPLESNIRHRPEPVDTARNPETARG